MKASQFEHQDVFLNYYQTGTGDNDLFIQHGLYDDSLCWGNLPRDLGANYRVTLMDARGFGLSSKPEIGYDMDTMAEDMAALIKYLDLDQPVVIGHSMGASLGCHLAALHPDLLKGVVLIDPAFREPESPDLKADLLAGRVSELQHQQTLTNEEMVSAIRAKHPDWTEEFVLPAAESKFRMSLKALTVLNTIDTTWKSDLLKARCPMLLLTADIDLGAIVSKETAVYACTSNPLIKSLNIRGAGHSIHREKYTEVLDSIETFLSDI